MFRIYGSVIFAIAFIGWILYQAIAKKKTLSELKPDILMVVFFIGIWIIIYLWLLS